MFKLKKLLSFGVLVFFALSFFACGGSKSKLSLARSQSKQDMEACTKLMQKKKHEEAIKCFEAYKSRHFGQSSAVLADLAVADTYYAKKDWLVAAQAYQIFIETNPSSEKIPYAYYMAGLAYYKDTPKGIDRDQDSLELAVKYLGMAVQYYPGSSYAEQAKEAYNKARLKLAKKDFYVGRFYFRSREYLAAIPRFQEILNDYPQLGLDEDSFYYMIKALSETQQKELATKYFEVFKTHFPQSKYVKRIAGFI